MKQNLQELFNKYINECQYTRRLRPETLNGYKEVFRHFLAMMPEVTTSEMLIRETVPEFFYRLEVRKRIVGKGVEKQGIRSSTIKTYWSKLNAFFEWLRLKEYIQENPLMLYKPPEVEYEDRRALERSEIYKIIAAITLYSKNTFLKKRDSMIVMLMLFCGLRKSELLSLLVSDVDLDNRTLLVRGKTSKSKKTRQIPINPTLHLHLYEYFQERKNGKYTSAYLIVSANKDQALTSHGLKHWVEKLSELSKVPFHVHRFRHTFACNLARQNTSAIKIQKLMGHADLRMTEQYVRSMTVEDFRQDIGRLNIDNLI